MTSAHVTITTKPARGLRMAPWAPPAAALLGAGWGSNQFSPMLLVYGPRLGLGTGTLEAMFGFYALGLIPGLLVAGPLSDARGRRAVVIPAAGLSLVATIVLIAGGQLPGLLFAGRLLTGLATGAVFGAGAAWLRETSGPPLGDADGARAARRTAVAMTLGFALGPLSAGLLAQWGPAPTVVPFVPHIALMAAVLVFLRAAPETVIEGARGAPPLRFGVPDSRRFRTVVAPMAPWVFAGPAIAFALLPNVIGANRASGGIALTASITMLCALAGVLIQPAGRRIDARSGSNPAAIAGLLVLVAGLALAVVTALDGAVWMLVPSSIVLGCAYGLCLVAGLIEVQRLADQRALAAATAAYYALTYVGFAAPFLLTLGARAVGYPAVLAVSAGFALCTAARVKAAA
jgi:hypothetical protein